MTGLMQSSSLAEKMWYPSAMCSSGSVDHTFIDTEGHLISGRDACREAWIGFIDTFPGYRNTFTSVTVDGNRVTMAGFSTCSEPALTGPALWTATIHGDRVTEWRVYDDTPGNRVLLEP